jgi:hypothetical protein
MAAARLNIIPTLAMPANVFGIAVPVFVVEPSAVAFPARYLGVVDGAAKLN